MPLIYALDFPPHTHTAELSKGEMVTILFLLYEIPMYEMSRLRVRIIQTKTILKSTKSNQNVF